MIDHEKFREGDHKYFAEIVRANGLMVRRVCLFFEKSEDERDDLVQGIFTLAYKHRRSFRGDGPFAAWLHRLSTNHCLSVYRSRKAERLGIESIVAKDGIQKIHPKTRDPEEEFDRKEAERILRESVDALPEKEREAIVLRFLEGRTPTEVAERMKITKASVRSNISRGLKRLRGILKGEKK
jgi:RNA polymerase sigma-70 factor (ECF subfamily)